MKGDLHENHIACVFLGECDRRVSGPGGVAGNPVTGTAVTAGSVETGNPYRKQLVIKSLASEGRAMRVADGGMLTPEHHAYLQAKLNAILAGNY